MTKKGYTDLETVHRWIQRHRAVRGFTVADVCKAFGFGVDQMKHRQAISGRLKTLMNHGMIINTTPKKAKNWVYKITAKGMEGYRPSDDVMRTNGDSPPPFVNRIELGSGWTAPLPQPTAPAGIITRLDRIEKMMEKIAKEWGIQ